MVPLYQIQLKISVYNNKIYTFDYPQLSTGPGTLYSHIRSNKPCRRHTPGQHILAPRFWFVSNHTSRIRQREPFQRVQHSTLSKQHQYCNREEDSNEKKKTRQKHNTAQSSKAACPKPLSMVDWWQCGNPIKFNALPGSLSFFFLREDLGRGKSRREGIQHSRRHRTIGSPEVEAARIGTTTEHRRREKKKSNKFHRDELGKLEMALTQSWKAWSSWNSSGCSLERNRFGRFLSKLQKETQQRRSN